VSAAAPGTIDEYIAGLPAGTQQVLAELRRVVREAAPGATERISYGMPTFDLKGRPLVHVAGWKKHIGLYPVTEVLARTFADELKPYKMSGKGTVQFPLGKPMPLELIRRIVEFRAREVAADAP
jgi:uncharacterized protein YdhG (YjbR/CyaY superfamily)